MLKINPTKLLSVFFFFFFFFLKKKKVHDGIFKLNPQILLPKECLGYNVKL